MTAREYINQAFFIDKEINENILELEALKSEMCRCTQVFSDIQGEHNSNSSESRLLAYIDKHNKLQKTINNDIDRLIDIKTDIRNKIMKIPESKYKIVLAKRYILFKKWEKIQEEMGYAETSSIHKLHRKAIGRFERINGKNF